MEENLIKRLLSSVKCRVCGQRYDANSIDVMDCAGNLWFLKVSCSFCQTQSLMVAVVKEDKTPELVTDLTEAEIDRFKDVEALSTDDVLDMYNLLRDFDGDFSHLFSDEETL